MLPFWKARRQKKAFPLKVDVLNYTPVGYQIPLAWEKFLGSIEGKMKQVLDQTNPDEMNDNMFDALVDAAAQEVRTSALRQRTEHLHTIYHDQSVLLGEVAEIRALRRDLEEALDEIARRLKESGARATV